ncbi:hypothetical protein ACQ5SO_16455 [Rhodovulum sp. DZ06]|uniref:hypothetical protein n=1 Tax=Rhodovulum sp. DZ06 TaxID=3425126 RepID=UPI003D345837
MQDHFDVAADDRFVGKRPLPPIEFYDESGPGIVHFELEPASEGLTMPRVLSIAAPGVELEMDHGTLELMHVDPAIARGEAPEDLLFG